MIAQFKIFTCMIFLIKHNCIVSRTITISSKDIFFSYATFLIMQYVSFDFIFNLELSSFVVQSILRFFVDWYVIPIFLII